MNHEIEVEGETPSIQVQEEHGAGCLSTADVHSRRVEVGGADVTNIHFTLSPTQPTNGQVDRDQRPKNRRQWMRVPDTSGRVGVEDAQGDFNFPSFSSNPAGISTPHRFAHDSLGIRQTKAWDDALATLQRQPSQAAHRLFRKLEDDVLSLYLLTGNLPTSETNRQIGNFLGWRPRRVSRVLQRIGNLSRDSWRRKGRRNTDAEPRTFEICIQKPTRTSHDLDSSDFRQRYTCPRSIRLSQGPSPTASQDARTAKSLSLGIAKLVEILPSFRSASEAILEAVAAAPTGLFVRSFRELAEVLEKRNQSFSSRALKDAARKLRKATKLCVCRTKHERYGRGLAIALFDSSWRPEQETLTRPPECVTQRIDPELLAAWKRYNASIQQFKRSEEWAQAVRLAADDTAPKHLRRARDELAGMLLLITIEPEHFDEEGIPLPSRLTNLELATKMGRTVRQIKTLLRLQAKRILIWGRGTGRQMIVAFETIRLNVYCMQHLWAKTCNTQFEWYEHWNLPLSAQGTREFDADLKDQVSALQEGVARLVAALQGRGPDVVEKQLPLLALPPSKRRGTRGQEQSLFAGLGLPKLTGSLIPFPQVEFGVPDITSEMASDRTDIEGPLREVAPTSGREDAVRSIPEVAANRGES